MAEATTATRDKPREFADWIIRVGKASERLALQRGWRPNTISAALRRGIVRADSIPGIAAPHPIYRPPEPGTVLPGEWAHVRHQKRQHLVSRRRGRVVQFACGHETYPDAVWHGAGLPHLPRCGNCERTGQ